MRLDTWVRGDGIQFDSPEAGEKYRELATLFRDAVELKKTPARVPISGLGEAFALRRVGIDHKATIYDRWEETVRAMVDFTKEYGVYR